MQKQSMKFDKLNCSPDWYDGEVRSRQAPEKVQEFFEKLRSKNLVTVMGEGCCTGCTSGAARQKAEKENAFGYVGFHEQDVESYREIRDDTSPIGTRRVMSPEYDSFYVFFGGNEKFEKTDGDIGEIIMEVAEDFEGVEAEWDGDSNTRVKLNF